MNASLVKILISFARNFISRVIPSAIKFLPCEDNDHFCQQVDLKGNPFRRKMPLRLQVTCKINYLMNEMSCKECEKKRKRKEELQHLLSKHSMGIFENQYLQL